jgi:HK97 family phage major capsid protein
MYNSKKLAEQIAEMEARCDAIVATGELTDELRAELDRCLGQGEEGDADFKAGELHKLKADLKRLKAIETHTKKSLEVNKGTIASVTPGKGEADQQDKAKLLQTPIARCAHIDIPVQSRFRYGELKAYKGDNSEEKAFLAGMFFIGALLKDNKAIGWCKSHGIDMDFRAALGENQNQLGGVLVPEEVEQTVIDLREKYGVARQECKVTPMMSDTKTVPRRTGGLTAYFVDENPSSGITESDKNWDNIRLVARTLATLTRYSMQLSEDAIISVGDDLTTEIAYAFALKEDQCLFLGDGTSTYGKIYGVPSIAAGSVVTAATGNTAFSTLDLADFESMVGKLPQYAEANAKWYISKAGWAASMLRLIDAGGGNTWRDLANGKRELVFLGYPVVISQVMNSTLSAQVNATNVALFGDMQMAATLGNRRGLSVFPSEHRYMEYNQIGVRGMERFDINFHERGDATNAGAMISMTLPGS